MNIVVTGITGFIGSNLLSAMLNHGYSVYSVVRPSTRVEGLTNKCVKVFVFDNNFDDLVEFMLQNNIQGVVHLASLFLAQHSSKDISALVDSNILFGLNLLEACKIVGIKWFLNTGTFWQHYNGEEYNPVNLYASTKQAFEDIAKYYSETCAMQFVTIKLNDTYGPSDSRRKIIAIWDSQKESDLPLSMSPGNQLIDIVHIDDVVQAFLKLIYLLINEDPIVKGGIFYITSGEQVTLRELSKIYEKYKKKQLRIDWGKKQYREREVMEPKCIGKVVPGWKAEKSILNGQIFSE